MNVIKCCNGCEKRHLGCHSTCEDYAKAKAHADDKYNAMRKKYIAEAYIRKKGIRLSRWRHTR